MVLQVRTGWHCWAQACCFARGDCSPLAAGCPKRRKLWLPVGLTPIIRPGCQLPRLPRMRPIVWPHGGPASDTAPTHCLWRTGVPGAAAPPPRAGYQALGGRHLSLQGAGGLPRCQIHQGLVATARVLLLAAVAACRAWRLTSLSALMRSVGLGGTPLLPTFFACSALLPGVAAAPAVQGGAGRRGGQAGGHQHHRRIPGGWVGMRGAVGWEQLGGSSWVDIKNH